jgi:PilM
MWWVTTRCSCTLIFMPLYIPVFFAALLAMLAVSRLPVLNAQNVQAKSAQLVVGLLAYRQGINAYVYTHPELTGEIDPAQVVMPEGFVDKGLWRNYVEKGVVFIYPSPDHPSPQDAIDQAYRYALRTPLVGTHVNGKLIGATGFDTQLSVPLVIPNGSLVIAGN